MSARRNSQCGEFLHVMDDEAVRVGGILGFGD
jgi:hypothetical protein